MKLRIATFNLFQFAEPPYYWYIKKDKFKVEEFEKKKEWIKEQITQMNCDVIGFQEVFSQQCLKELMQDLGFTYFEIVDEAKTSKQNPNVYISTTVAIASKYPIKKIRTVPLYIPTLKQHNFEGHFKFSRLPVCATIELENQQMIQVYVCHLKSNRLNEFEYIFTKDDSFDYKVTQIQKALKENYSPALKQRLCEATSLFYDIQKSKYPTVLMCDLNDKEYSLTIDVLSNQKYHYKNKSRSYLYDAYYIFDKKVYNPHPEDKPIKRTATSYYQSYGNVIDYIFVSKHFNKKNKDAIAKISSYEVYDTHLKQNQNGSLLQSDHAPVVCEVEFKKELTYI